jgi:hypothetical protein
MSDDIAIVFTARSTERILREGGTASWRLDRKHARRCIYAVCTRNAHHHLAEGSEAHHSAFLIGRISDVVLAPDHMGLIGDTPQAAGKHRYLIQFSEYAPLNIPEVWKGDRNPVKYGTLGELGIDVSTLNWQPMPAVLAPVSGGTAVKGAEVGALTMAQAKTGLALTFGVPPEAIEITIRG